MTNQGTLIHIDSQPALRFERRYEHPVERVWRAISDPAEMASWFPSNVEGERAVGADLTFVDEAQRAAAPAKPASPTRDESAMLHGRVVAYDPPKVFSFTWGGELPPLRTASRRAQRRCSCSRRSSATSQSRRGTAAAGTCASATSTRCSARVPPTRDGWKDVYQDYLERMGPELGSAGPATVRCGGSGPPTSSLTARPRASPRTRPRSKHGARPVTSDEPVQWEVEPAGNHTVYRLTHQGIGDDAQLAATWHALLVQLDMYLAAGQLIPVDPKPWVDAYAELLQ